MHCDAHRHLGRQILSCLSVRHVPGGLLAYHRRRRQLAQQLTIARRT
jgi:hypothetical protein